MNGRRNVQYSTPNLYLPASSIIKPYRAILVIKTYRAHQQAPTRKCQLVSELVAISSKYIIFTMTYKYLCNASYYPAVWLGYKIVRLIVWTSRTCLISRLLLSSYVLFEKLSSSWLSCTRFYLKQPQATTQAAARSTVVDWPRPWARGPQRMSGCVGGTS